MRYAQERCPLERASVIKNGRSPVNISLRNVTHLVQRVRLAHFTVTTVSIKVPKVAEGARTPEQPPESSRSTETVNGGLE